MNGQLGREDAIIEAALDLPPEARGPFVEKACGDDLPLRQLVEALLKVHERLAGLREQPASPTAEFEPQHPAEKLGDHIGRYKLLQQIGEGGCGVVFMAQQEEPVRRRVALKIIKLGMDTKQVIARFEAERQALALMDHPNIARVLDAGATETGRPFFVMELVRGRRITDFCDQEQLPTRERLELFVQVCQAVQHAHQKGVIHRDLKPSNILVTVNDGVSIPKVIDFGIAKATQGRLTDKTLVTAFEQFIGTPAYMSPEQAVMTSLDIDTRTDIYSLGVLLYELLTGKTPFDTQELLAAGVDALRRTIRDIEPIRPSTRLNTMIEADLSTLAAHRRTEPAALTRLVRGDLDWIVMKCLEKDRKRRYETASDLAADIKRHLANEPVTARPPSAADRVQKAWRRHKTVYSAAALMAVVLLTATAISAWQAIRANQRLADSQAIAKFLTEVFQSPDPVREGRTITVAESLNAAAKKLETDLSNQPARRASLQATLGLTYHALGLDGEAIALQEKARNYYLAASGPEKPETLTVMHQLADSYDQARRFDDALKLREQELEIRRRVNGHNDPETLRALTSVGVSYMKTDRTPEAIKLLEDTLATFRRIWGAENAGALETMHFLVLAYVEAKQLDKALALSEEALAINRRLRGPEHPDTLKATADLVHCYGVLQRYDDAIAHLEELLKLERKVFGPEHPETLLIMRRLLSNCIYANHRDEALEVAQDLVPLSRKVYGSESPVTTRAMWELSRAYLSVGRSQEALSLLKDTTRLTPNDNEGELTLATWQAWFGRDADYEATRRLTLERALDTHDAPTADHAAKAYCLRPSANNALLAQALELARRAAEIEKGNPWLSLGLGLAEYRNGHLEAAEKMLALANQTAGQFQELRGTAQLFRAMSVFRQNRALEADNLLQDGAAQMPPFPGDESNPFAHVEVPGQTFDLLIWWLAYKEAKGLLTQAPKP